MRKLNVLLLVLPLLSLVGCASDPTTITTKFFEEGGLEPAREVVENISDNGVAKQKIINATLDKLIEAEKTSAVTPRVELKKEMTERTMAITGTVGGQKVDLAMTWSEPVITEVKVRDPFKFNQPLPINPAPHPFWETSKTYAKIALGAFGLDRFFGFMGDVSSASKYAFYGDAEIENFFPGMTGPNCGIGLDAVFLQPGRLVNG